MDPERRRLIADIDRDITSMKNSVSLYHRSHWKNIGYIPYNLANAHWSRYRHSQEKEDLDKSILLYTLAVLLLPVSLPGLTVSMASNHHIPRLFSNLTVALRERSEKYKQPEGIEYSIKYLQYLRRFPTDSFDVPRSVITRSLIGALGVQVEWGDGNETRNHIKEMVALCRELLTSNLSVPGAFPIDVFMSLVKAARAEYERGRPFELLLDEVIECLRDAMKMCPPGSDNAAMLPLRLVEELSIRFFTAHSFDDYKEATALLENIVDPNQPGGCPDTVLDVALLLSTQLKLIRYALFPSPECSEESIARLRATLNSGPPSIVNQHRSKLTDWLSMLVRDRYTGYSLFQSLEVANSNISQLVDLASSQSLGKSGMSISEPRSTIEGYSMTAVQQKIQDIEELLSNTPPGTIQHKERLGDLGEWYESKFCCTEDTSDLEESIKYTRMSLDVTSASDPLRFGPLLFLRKILFLAFEQTKEIGYLNESIVVDYEILELKTAQPYHFRITQRLVHSLFIRDMLLGRRDDRHEAIRLILVYIDYQYAQEPDRFELACRWAILARSIEHSTTLTAYKTAMSLMQQALSSPPTVSVQHTHLLAMGVVCQTMPLEYASYQIELGQIDEAVETLEQGRALLWSEMRGLQNPMTQLVEDPLLAKRFAEINLELEALTISFAPSGELEIEGGVAQDGMDPFGRLVIKRKKLVEERDALISQIQCQPGLEGFMRPPSFTTLRSAASRGPVILINHCGWRSDIVIIFGNYLPCVIPTPKHFFASANKLRDNLVKARKCGLNSVEYEDTLCSVLKGLYKLVGEPVVKTLRLLGVPEQSRIWWCPTSVFCSLPLHAMGPITSSQICKQYFSDLYIPSYTPSLSALIESRKASSQIPERPSLLLVAQPDDDLPGVNGEIKVILERAVKAQIKVTSLVSSEATPPSVLESLRDGQFVHFASHGVLETGKPFEASFKLHRGSRLTLLDIIKSRLPDAEFAFLSCCHTAEITEASVADEVLHLTAAMQYCGFRSVVGTMWEMADLDGTDLAKNFYKSLFSSQDSGMPYYERSAGALRDTIQKLRGKRGITLERWVNFVHYGA